MKNLTAKEVNGKKRFKKIIKDGMEKVQKQS